MTIDINFNGITPDMGTNGGSSVNFLQNILQKLDTTLDKLNNTISTIQKSPTSAGNVSSGGGSSTQGTMDRLANRFGVEMGKALAAAVGITAVRVMNNYATAIMGRASNAGGFIAQSIAGNANAAFGGYAANYVNIAGRLAMSNNTALAEGMGGLVGAGLGSIGGGLLGMAVGNVPGALKGIKDGMYGGAAIGVGVGDLGAAYYQNQYIQKAMMIQAAEVERNANASVSQWKTGFSRFGLKMTQDEIVSGALTGGAPITGMFSNEFMQKYGSSQNFNAIQNNIVPYLSSGTNIMSDKNDLNRVAQNFLKAGFAVSDFSKLTMQATQAQTISGKNIKEFSDDILLARNKFGDAYDLNTNQTALNLMQLGISQPRAQHLAYQGMFNPGVMGGIDILAHSSFADYYKRKAISNRVGFDVNKSLAMGSLVDQAGNPIAESERQQILKETNQQLSGGVMSKRLMYLTAVMGTNATTEVARLAHHLIREGTDLTGTGKNKLLDGSLAPGQQNAYNSPTAAGLMQNVQDMTVNAWGQINIINNAAGSLLSHQEATTHLQTMQNARFGRLPAPSAAPPHNTPTVKH